MKLVNIGFGSMAAEEHIISIVGSDSSPIKRMIQEARSAGTLIDASYGRKCRSVLVMTSGHILLSGLSSDVIAQRAGGEVSEADVIADD